MWWLQSGVWSSGAGVGHLLCVVCHLCVSVVGCCVSKMTRFRTQIDGSKAKIKFRCALQGDEALLALPPHELQAQ